MGEQTEGIFLSQKKNSTLKNFVILEIDLDFLVQEEQREEGILTSNSFVRREEGRGIGLGIILSKRVKGRKGVGLRINCPNKREKKRRGEQVGREISSPVS